MIKDINDVIKLIDKINSANINTFTFKTSEFELSMEKGGVSCGVKAAPEISYIAPGPEEAETVKSVNDDNCQTIKSPIVGIFHSLESMGKGSLKVGDKVKKGDVVCIIEAMKLMNEVESSCDGEVVEICVNDGDHVEYGQVLIKLK